MRTVAVTACPACAGELFADVGIGAHRLRRCRACGLVSAPEVAAAEELYVEGYLTGGSDFGPPDTTHPLFQMLLRECGHRRLREIERLAARAEPLLDVGCGTGDVLVAARDLGWRAVGVEPVTESARIALERGVEVIPTRLEHSGLDEQSFGLATAFHVLEHMTEPVAFLRLMARWVRPGGYVAVEVPNFDSVQRRRLGDSWPGLRPLEHVGHYSANTLAKTMARAGLERVRVRSLTFQWTGMELHYALNDLGLKPGGHRLDRFAAVEERNGAAGRYPKPGLSRALGALARAYDVRRKGMVVLGVGRVRGNG